MESENKINESKNLADSPIIHESQDRLRRNPFIESLYEEITSLSFEDSFCFGLYGSWGEGKTSVLRLLKNKLKENKNITLFEFDPWYLTSKEVILKNFLEGLQWKLRPIPKEFKNIFKNYFRKLSSVGISAFGFGFQAGWNSVKSETSELKKKINDFLFKKFKKKIVVFIDDVDRLQPEEILQVFKLVKLVADFKHTIFVLSMDVIFVKKALKSQKIDVEYIDKIVQKPVPLPKIEKDDIDNFLGEELNALFKKLKIEDQKLKKELENFFFIYQKYAGNLFITLRNVKRYVNSLSSSLIPIVDEVQLFDFIILEIIKVFAPILYDNIYENWWFYVEERYPRERNYNPLLWQYSQDDQKKLEAIKDHIEELLSKQPRKEVFRNLLGVLFPNVNNAFKLYNSFSEGAIARQEKRIYSTSFPKYFTLKVPSSEIPDALVNQIVSSWSNVPPDKLTEVITETFVRFKQNGKLIEFFTKLNLLENIITPEVTPALICSLYQNSPNFSKESKGGWIESEFHRADNLIVNLLRDKIENTKVQTILEEVMVHSDSLDFASGVYILCTQEQKHRPNEKWKILPAIRKVLVDRFKNDFIKPQVDFFQSGEPSYVLTMLWNLCAEEEKVDLKECTYAEYMRNILEKEQKHIGKLLSCFLQRWVGTKGTSLELKIDEVSKYLDTNALYKRIMKENKEVYTTDEEKKSVDLFIKNYKTLNQNDDN
jgi:hypothetical protein